MGQTKKMLMEQEEFEKPEGEMQEFYKRLLNKDDLPPIVKGIARYFIDKGLDTLSSRQREVLEDFIDQFKTNNSCEICVNGNISSLTEYIDISEEGLCFSCLELKENYMEG